MKRLILAGAVLGTIAAFLAACLLVPMTLIWMTRSWHPAPWVVELTGLGLMAAVVAMLWRWWLVPPDRRFWFNLRGTLFGVILLALWAATIGTDLLQWRRECRAAMSLRQKGIKATSDVAGDQKSSSVVLTLPWAIGFDPLAGVRAVEIYNDSGIADLAGHAKDLAELEEVRFRGMKVEDAGLNCIAELDRFSVLHSGEFQQCVVTDSGLEQLAAWKGLESLCFDDCFKITDVGLAHLEELPNLRTLKLRHDILRMFPTPTITDAGMRHVGCLKQLRHLELIGLPITDEGVACLEGIANLERLVFDRCEVSGEGIRRLRKAFPDCFISWEEEEFPAVRQIRQFEIYRTGQWGRQLAIIDDRTRIAGIKMWLDQYMQESRKRGPGERIATSWLQGPLPTTVHVRVEGPSRRLYEFELGPGVFRSRGRIDRRLLPGEEHLIRTLLGVDANWEIR